MRKSSLRGGERSIWQKQENARHRRIEREIVEECRSGNYSRFRSHLYSKGARDLNDLFRVTQDEFDLWTMMTQK
jgi:hypothetical protein